MGQRRSIIVTCEDLKCRFMLKRDYNEKLKGECFFDLQDAIRFGSKYDFSICDLGMCRKDILDRIEKLNDSRHDTVLDKYIRICDRENELKEVK